MDWGLCQERNRWGKKASWRRRGSGSRRAGRYDACWNHGIDVHRPKETFEEILVAIGDSLSDVASSDDGEDGEDDNEEETEQGKLCEDDDPGCMMGTITKTVQQRMERFGPQQMKLDELTQRGCEDAPDHFREQDNKYRTSELSVPAVIQPHMNDDARAPPLTTFGELLEPLDIGPGISQRPQGTSRPESSRIRLCPVKLGSRLSIPSGEPAAEPDSSMLLNAQPVEPVSFYPCI